MARKRRDAPKRTATRKAGAASAGPSEASDVESEVWWAWGWIIGPALPLEKVRIGQAEILRVTGTQLRHSLRKIRPVPIIVGLKHGFQVIPPQVLIHSTWQVRWRFVAPDRPSAGVQLLDVLVPELLDSLNTLFESPYRIETMRFGPVINGQDVEGQGHWKHSSTMYAPTVVRELTLDHLSLAAARLETLSKGGLAANEAARYYRDAVQASDLVTEPLVGFAPLLGFHLCIERILKEVGGSDLSDREERQRAPIEELTNILGSQTVSVNLKAEAIRQAQTALDEISHSRYKIRLSATVRKLGLAEKHETRLSLFYEFRNKYLGHPNRLLERTEMEAWTAEGNQLSRVLLAAYLDHLSGNAPPAVGPIDNSARLSEQEGTVSVKVLKLDDSD